MEYWSAGAEWFQVSEIKMQAANIEIGIRYWKYRWVESLSTVNHSMPRQDASQPHCFQAFQPLPVEFYPSAFDLPAMP
jgi:hypothetical protein